MSDGGVRESEWRLGNAGSIGERGVAARSDLERPASEHRDFQDTGRRSDSGPQAESGRRPSGRPYRPWRAATARVFAQNIVDVAASPQAVWSQLIDCVAWPQWYKHCSDVSILRGGWCLSSDSKFRFKTLGFYFEPEVVTFEPHHTLVWSARGPAGTSGSHAWYVEATPGGCRVITEESQSGLLLFFLGARTRERLLVSHEEWLRALKERAEEIRN
jgi:hypothetical protein